MSSGEAVDAKEEEAKGPSIVDWIKWMAGGAPTLKDARSVLMRNLVPSPMVARRVTKTVDVKFKGSYAQFQAAADRGIPISVRLGDLFPAHNFLPRQKKVVEGMSPLEQSVCTQLTPDKFDLEKAIVHEVTIHSFDNSFGEPLGLHCDAVPKAYMNMGDKDIKHLLRFFTDGSSDMWCNKHIPGNTKGGHRIPLIKQVGNGYNSEAIVGTFGPIFTGEQIMNGLVVLPVELCKNLGLPPPKKPYLVPDHVDTSQMSPEELATLKVNTWVLVPQGHAHTWATSLPHAHLRSLGYEIHELKVEGENVTLVQTEDGGERTIDDGYVPFYLMDFLTIDKLNHFVGRYTLPNIDRRDIRGVTFTLQPFMATPETNTQNAPWRGVKWTDYPSDPEAVHEVTLSMVVSYTLLPRGVDTNPQIACILTPDFPPMRVDGAVPMLSGAGGGDESEAQKRQK